jgi:hypothetical protein
MVDPRPVKRRWYQLSMLQLLVVMAVVALLYSANQIDYKTEDLSDNLGLYVAEAKYGWPFTYRVEKSIVSIQDGTVKKSQRAGSPTIKWQALVGNVAVGLIIATASLTVLKASERKRSS